MNNLNLSSVLLFCLAVPFIMTYRLGPGKIETPYWLFGITFVLLLGNLGLDLVNWQKSKIEKWKSILVWVVIVLVIGSAYTAAILVRHRTAPIYQIHDIVLQQEAAIRFLLQGKNPYALTYFGTPLEQWHYSENQINPALYHFVMMPGYLLFSLPFYFLSLSFFGFFDGRLPLVFLFGVMLILAWKLIKNETEKRRLFLVLLAFNPATLGYFLEGRGDIFMFAFLFGSLFLLEKKRYALSGVPLALAFGTKQSSWLIFPFYLGYLYFKGIKEGKKIEKLISYLFPFGLTFAIVVLPFLFWDGKAFLDSTVYYLTGQTEHSYPITGYGWGMLLYQMGVIKNLSQYYPFWIWQLIFCLPLFVILFRWFKNSLAVWRLIFAYAIFTLVFWYFSRYFNNSHLGYLSMVFLTAFFWPREKLSDKK